MIYCMTLAVLLTIKSRCCGRRSRSHEGFEVFSDAVLTAEEKMGEVCRIPSARKLGAVDSFPVCPNVALAAEETEERVLQCCCRLSGPYPCSARLKFDIDPAFRTVALSSQSAV